MGSIRATPARRDLVRPLERNPHHRRRDHPAGRLVGPPDPPVRRGRTPRPTVASRCPSTATSPAHRVFTAVGPSRLYDSVTATIGTTPSPLKVAGKAGVPTNATAVAPPSRSTSPTAAANSVVAPYQSTSRRRPATVHHGPEHLRRPSSSDSTSGDIQLRVYRRRSPHPGQRRRLLQRPATGSRFTAVGPSRLYDSVTAKIGTTTSPLKVAGQAGVPTNATAVALTIRSTSPTADGRLVVTPYQQHRHRRTQQFSQGQTCRRPSSCVDSIRRHPVPRLTPARPGSSSR